MQHFSMKMHEIDFKIDSGFSCGSTYYNGITAHGSNCAGQKRFEFAVHGGSCNGHFYTDTGSWRDTGYQFNPGTWYRVRQRRASGTLHLYTCVMSSGPTDTCEPTDSRWSATNVEDYTECETDSNPQFKVGNHVTPIPMTVQNVRVIVY